MWSRGATWPDVDAVCDNLSQITADEMIAAGIKNRWHIKMRAKVCRDKGFLHVGLIGDEPIYLFGAAQIDTNRMATWFAGTDRYFTPDINILRHTIEHMAKMQQIYGNFDFESASYSRDPATLKWFRTIGFDYKGTLPNGARHFVYRGRNSTNQKECATFLD